MVEFKSEIIDAVSVLQSSNVSVGNIARSLDISERDVKRIQKLILEDTDPIREMYVAVNKYNSMIATVDMLIAKEKDDEDPDLNEIHKLLDKEEKYQKAKVDLLNKLQSIGKKTIDAVRGSKLDHYKSIEPSPEGEAKKLEDDVEIEKTESDKTLNLKGLDKFTELEEEEDEKSERDEVENDEVEEEPIEDTKQKLIGFDSNGEPIFEEIDTEPDEIVETDKREKIEYLYRLMINLDARNKTWGDLMYLTKTEEEEIQAAIGCNEKDYKFILKHLISRKIPKHPSGKEHMKRMRKKWLR